jgi:hypothetical protein
MSRRTRGDETCKRRTPELTTPERALAVAASLQGRSRASNRGDGGGGKARNSGVRKGNLSVTIT